MTRGVPFKCGGATFLKIGRLSLYRRLRQKKCTKSCELTSKIIFLLTSEGAHPPQTPPVPIEAAFLLVLNLGAPCYK